MMKDQYPAQAEQEGNPRQGSPGSGEPYVPTKEPSGNPHASVGGGSDNYPYPVDHDINEQPSGPAQRGDNYPYPDAHSTVRSEDAGPGGNSADAPYPVDLTSDKFMDYAGGDGGDYMNNVPGETDSIVPSKEWSPNYGHSKSVTAKGTFDTDNVDMGDWDSPGTLEAGYAVLPQTEDGDCPALPDGEQYPEPKADPWES